MNKIIIFSKTLTSTMMAILLLLLAAMPAIAATYTYDNLNRLISSTYDNGQKITYTYDAGGNMLTAGATSVAYHVYGDVLLNGAGKSGTIVSIAGGEIDFTGNYGVTKDTVHGKVYVGDSAAGPDRVSYYFDVPYGTYTITASSAGQKATALVSTDSTVLQKLDYGSYYIQGVAEISLSPAATLTGITLDSTSYGLAVGENRNTVVAAVYSDGKNIDVTGLAAYQSTNPAVATVSPSGVITGLSPGMAEITATYGGKTAAAMVTVTASTVPVIGLTLDKTALSITAGGPSATLTATVLPDNATNKSVTWISSNPAAASVTANGNTAAITPLAAGNTTVTASAADGGYTAVCDVTVNSRYIFSGVLKPIREDGTSVFRLGRSIPVKFRLKDTNENFVPNATAKLYLSRMENGVPGNEMEATPSGKANKGNLFRNAKKSHKNIFNLKTKDLTAGTWRLRILLDDGASHYVTIELKEHEKHQDKNKDLQEEDLMDEDEDKDKDKDEEDD